jgi:hypothetical protein
MSFMYLGHPLSFISSRIPYEYLFLRGPIYRLLQAGSIQVKPYICEGPSVRYNLFWKHKDDVPKSRLILAYVHGQAFLQNRQNR